MSNNQSFNKDNHAITRELTSSTKTAQGKDQFVPTASQEQRWKFRFKHGEMIEDTDIGPENSSISQHTFANHFKLVFYAILSRKTNWLMAGYIIIHLSVSAHKDTFLDLSLMIIFLVSSIVVHLGVELFCFSRLSGLEKIWNHKKVQSLKRNKLKQRRFHEKSSDQIKVGDLVLLKSNSTSPFDILILDTSEQKHDDKITHVSERRLNGQRGVLVKKSIKNLNPQSKSMKNGLSVAKKDALVKYNLDSTLQILKGQIEYDSPNRGINDFSGNFKLSNDPKVMKFSQENMVFCGSRVYNS